MSLEGAVLNVSSVYYGDGYVNICYFSPSVRRIKTDELYRSLTLYKSYPF